MAIKATVYKAQIDLSDIDRGYYNSHTLTLARHPSETEERMMIRLLAFVLNAHERLEFGRGLSTDDEPDLWQLNDDGSIEHWIDVGLPDIRRIRRAAGRASSLSLLAYGSRPLQVWWQKNAVALSQIQALKISSIPDDAAEQLAGMAARNMVLSCTIQETQIAFGSATDYVVFQLAVLQ